MSDTVAAVQFAGFFRQWQEIEDAKARLAEQSKDLFADMNALGYKGKTTRAVFRDKRKELSEELADIAKREEEEVHYDLYWAALNQGLSGPRAHPARSARENTEENGSAKLVERVVQAVQTETGKTALLAAVDIMIAREEFDPETGEITEQPETATRLGQDVQSPRQCTSAPENLDVTGGESAATNSHSLPTSSPVADMTGAEPPPTAPVALSDADVPAFLKKLAPAEPKINPQCKKAARGENCFLSHSQASCSACANAAMREKAVAA